MVESDERSRPVTVAIIAAGATILAALIAAIGAFVIASRDEAGSPRLPSATGSTTPSAVTTFDKPVTLRAGRLNSLRRLPVTAVINEGPGAGYEFWFFVEVHDVDPSNPHSEFYPHRELSSVPKTEIFDLDYSANIDLDQRRTARVFRVPNQVGDQLQAYVDQDQVPDEEVVRPPCRNCDAAREIEIFVK